MKITKIILRQLKMMMKQPFVTSFGTLQERDFLLLEVIDDNGQSGWGESVAFHAPWYTEETVTTVWHILEDFLIPEVWQQEISHPVDLLTIFSKIRRNNMAKFTLEGAIWDLYAKRQNVPLATAIGGKRKKIDIGISLGIQKKNIDLLHLIDLSLAKGYKRVKIKIKPDHDVSVVEEIRKNFPDLSLMVDANSAYRITDLELFRKLDTFGLLMIEQPFASNDMIDHAILQKEINTPICLDESICSFEDARKAMEFGSCRIMNIKLGRVGGLIEAKRIHDLCFENNLPVWCGGMFESGVGRAQSIALATLENFVFPSDTAGSAHYWHKDIINPEIVVNDGQIYISDNIGIGVEVDLKEIHKRTIFEKTFQYSP